MKHWTLAAILWITAVWMFKPTPADVRAVTYLAWQAYRTRRDTRRRTRSWTGS